MSSFFCRCHFDLLTFFHLSVPRKKSLSLDVCFLPPSCRKMHISVQHNFRRKGEKILNLKTHRLCIFVRSAKGFFLITGGGGCCCGPLERLRQGNGLFAAEAGVQRPISRAQRRGIGSGRLEEEGKGWCIFQSAAAVHKSKWGGKFASFCATNGANNYILQGVSSWP